MENFPFDLKVVLPLFAAYGLVLIHIYQLGFFSLIGFHFLGLSGILNFWGTAWIALSYVAFIALTSFLILAGFQISKQSGFDLTRWIADHDIAVTLGISLFTVSLMIVFAWLGEGPYLFLIPISFNFVLLVVSLYSAAVSYGRINVWTLFLALASPLMLSWAIGTYSALYVRFWNPQRFDIVLEDRTLHSVRLLHTSNAGILYSEAHSAKISFVNLSKLILIQELAQP